MDYVCANISISFFGLSGSELDSELLSQFGKLKLMNDNLSEFSSLLRIDGSPNLKGK